VSPVVLDEILAGIPMRPSGGSDGLRHFLLDVTPEVADLAAALIQGVPLLRLGPRRAHRRGGLLWDRFPTWNSTHIASEFAATR
jgi:hypothetical protein